MNSFYNNDELKQIGLKSCGSNIMISKKCSIYGAEKINIGDNVRIDDFCILSGNIDIASHVHISAGCYLFAGDAGIEIHDFSGLSSRCAVYAISDDYSGSVLTNAVIPLKYKNIISKKVVLQKHSIIGTGSTILPGVIISEGTSVGGMSLVTKNTLPWKIYFGIPAKPLKDRKKNLLSLEQAFMEEYYAEK